MSDLNKDFLAALDLDVEVIKTAEAEEIREGFEPIPSGAYKAEIKELATFKTAGGATMLKVEAYLPKEDKTITVYQNTVKKDGEANKIGQATFKHVIEAVVGTENGGLTAKKEKLLAWGKEVEGTTVKGLSGKPFIALVREVNDLSNPKFPRTNEIEGYVNVAGENIKGENLINGFKEKIEKTPVLERAAKPGAGGSSATAGATTADGKDISEML